VALTSKRLSVPASASPTPSSGFPHDHLCIVEVKLSWMGPHARNRKFYGPIVQAIYPNVTLSYLQIYKNAKTSSHKKPLSIYKLDEIPLTKYKECQWIGL